MSFKQDNKKRAFCQENGPKMENQGTVKTIVLFNKSRYISGYQEL